MEVCKGKAYYVSGIGKDGNDGLSTNTAFQTIQKAADLVKPGDTVLVMNGLYKNTPIKIIYVQI